MPADHPTPRIWPVILSGGSGTRLWPLSRSASPKQLLALAGPDPMIVTTAARTGDATRFHPPIVVTGRAHADLVRQQLGPEALLVVEPSARNTAPAIALAMLAVEREDRDGILLVMPSDHVITRPAALLAAIAAAAPAAQDGWLVTFGIAAASPETGYGYIRAGDDIVAGVRQVRQFIEKPDLARATAFVADGGYSWNAGIFLFSAAAMRAALATHAPAVLAAAEAAMTAACHSAGRIDPEADAFAAAPSVSIDNGVFEHAAKVAVCSVDLGWSDIGSWDALHDLGPRDTDGNLITGGVVSIESSGCLLRAEGTLLTAVGVDDLNIIATPDAVLVTARGRSQDVRAITARLAGDAVLARPIVVARPWGEERIIHDGPGTPVRRITVTDGAQLEIATDSRAMLVGGRALRDGNQAVPGLLADGPCVYTGQSAAIILVFG